MINVEIKVPKLGYNSAESYKSLRANLQFCGDDKRCLQLQAVHRMKERVALL